MNTADPPSQKNYYSHLSEWKQVLYCGWTFLCCWMRPVFALIKQEMASASASLFLQAAAHTAWMLHWKKILFNEALMYKSCMDYYVKATLMTQYIFMGVSMSRIFMVPHWFAFLCFSKPHFCWVFFSFYVPYLRSLDARHGFQLTFSAQREICEALELFLGLVW